jgi:hypothetical protein
MPAMPFKGNAAGRYHIPRQQQRLISWSEYDAALRQLGMVVERLRSQLLLA